MSLQRIIARGASVQGENLVIEGWPVQFLAAEGPLVEEALAEAGTFEVDGELVRVFSAEHLAAIALAVGRPRDWTRLIQFVEAGVLDTARFEDLLERHGLASRWHTFAERFLKGDS